MENRMMKSMVIVLVATLLGTAGVWADGKEVSAAQLPEAVMTAVKKVCPEGIIQEIELEKDDGQQVYEVELMVGKKGCDLKIALDGTVLEIERQVTVEELPEAVRNTLALFSDAEVRKAEMVQEDNEVSYEAVLKMGEHSFELEIAPDGKIVELELKGNKHDDDDDDDEDDDDD
jgi:uncharacterized membrane protein YkoI